jgi:acetolactate synthase small subunit
MSSPEAAVAETVTKGTSRFSLHASAEPGVMPRVLELFAKRGLVPDRWHSVVMRPSMTLSIDIEIGGVERETAAYVANCMRQIAGVELVLTV